MLESMKIMRRQSEIRQQLAELVGKENPTEDETRSMETLDSEYRQNETRYRASLIAEDTERRDAGNELETRSEQEWSELMAGFEMRQVALALDEGRQLDGQTAEIVSELRSAGGFRGIPVPWQAIEVRNTVSSATPNPVQTRPIIDRLFPDAVATRMGAQMISIESGAIEWPVTTSTVVAGWADGEGSDVAGPTAYQTTDRPLSPDHNLGVQMRITRRVLKQSGASLEQAVRRDVSSAMSVEMDKAVFLGSGANGQPLGVITGAAAYGITSTAIDEMARYRALTDAAARFMVRNAASKPSDIQMLVRPELWSFLDSKFSGDGNPIFDWDRVLKTFGEQNVVMSSNALDAPITTPADSTSAMLTTSVGGVAPVFVGAWGALDMIRDPYSDAKSGGLRITALATMDITVARPAQLELLTGLQIGSLV